MLFLLLSASLPTPFTALTPFREPLLSGFHGIAQSRMERREHIEAEFCAAIDSRNKPVRDSILNNLRDAVCRGRKLPSNEGRSVPVRPRARSIPPCFEGLTVEDLEYQSEANSKQGWVPLRIVKASSQRDNTTTPNPTEEMIRDNIPMRQDGRLPVVILLHKTRSDLQWYAEEQASYARRGYLAITIDCRYHGERTDPDLPYQDAILAAWRGSGQHPFLLDNVFDVLCLMDYLVQQRQDVDQQRIGVYGYSLGAMHGWLSMALDARISVGAFIGGIQWFRYDLENNVFQGRVDSIPFFFSAAAEDLGRSNKDDRVRSESGVVVEAMVVEEAWRRLLPGLLDQHAGYDAPNSLQLIIPRPILILQGDEDECCNLGGVRRAVAHAERERGLTSSRIDFFIEPGVVHTLTPVMVSEAGKYLDAILKPIQ